MSARCSPYAPTTDGPFFIRWTGGYDHGLLAEYRCSCGHVFVTRASRVHVGSVRYCGPCHGTATVKHGQYKTPEYKVWQAMIARCNDQNNPQYRDYGGRGIIVCQEWRDSFGEFIACIGKRPSDKHTIERLDNDLGYIPGNVVWATRHAQYRNRRSSVFVVLNGAVMIQVDAARAGRCNNETTFGRHRRESLLVSGCAIQDVDEHGYCLPPYSRYRKEAAEQDSRR